jgi:hypothetical protein
MLPKVSDPTSNGVRPGAKALSDTAFSDRAFTNPALSDKALDCYQHAHRCARQAEQQQDPKLREEFRYLERGWLKLARSLEFAEWAEPPKRLDP